LLSTSINGACLQVTIYTGNYIHVEANVISYRESVGVAYYNVIIVVCSTCPSKQ